MYEVIVKIGASASHYWADLEFEASGKVHRKQVAGERKASRQSNTLQALIEAVKVLRVPCLVTVRTDSEYLLEPFRQGWIQNWEQNSWKNAKGKTVRNAEQWQQARKALARHSVRFRYIKEEKNNV